MNQEQYFVVYIVALGSTKQRECREGPYDLDRALERRFEVIEQGFKNWKLELSNVPK